MAVSEGFGSRPQGTAQGTGQGTAQAPAALRIGQAVAAGLDHFGLARARLALPVVLYLLAVVLPVRFDLGPLNMTGVRLLLIVLVIPLILNLVNGKYGKLTLIDILFFAHSFWTIVTLAVNNPEQVVTNAGSTGIEFLGGYLVGRAFIRGPGDFVALCRWLVVIVLLLSPFVFYEMMTGQALILKFINAIPGLTSLRDISIGLRMGMDRVQSVFAHPIHSGLFFSTVFGLTFVGLKGTFNEVARWLVAGLAGTCAFLALSSGALLAMVMLIGLITWAQVFRRVRYKWRTLFILFAIAYVVVDFLSNRTPLMIFLSYATFSPHTAYMRSIILDWGLYNVGRNPLFGLGLNDWIRPGFMVSGSMDNFWLVQGVRYGIPGFVTVAGAYLLALFRIGWRDFGDDPLLLSLRRAWIFCMVGLAFTLSTVHVWHTIYSFVFFMFGSGLWLLTVEPRRAGDDAGTGDGAGAAPAAPSGPPPLGGTRPEALARRGAMPERLVPGPSQRAAPQTRIDTAPGRQPAAAADRASLRYSRFPARPSVRD